MSRSLATLACALALAAVTQGCGGDDDAPAPAAAGASSAPLPPDATPQPLGYGRDGRAALGRGAIGVVDQRNRVGIEPKRMAVNAEQELSVLRWSGWGSAQARARGRVRTLVCEPSCALGRVENSSAVLVLMAPKRCDGERFYAEASMTYREPGTGRTRAPATYLRTPC